MKNAWKIPENAVKPERINKRKQEPITLLNILKEQKSSKYHGGIYHKTQIELTSDYSHGQAHVGFLLPSLAYNRASFSDFGI